jgi:hypothetical protein
MKAPTEAPRSGDLMNGSFRGDDHARHAAPLHDPRVARDPAGMGITGFGSSEFVILL